MASDPRRSRRLAAAALRRAKRHDHIDGAPGAPLAEVAANQAAAVGRYGPGFVTALLARGERRTRTRFWFGRPAGSVGSARRRGGCRGGGWRAGARPSPDPLLWAQAPVGGLVASHVRLRAVVEQQWTQLPGHTLTEPALARRLGQVLPRHLGQAALEVLMGAAPDSPLPLGQLAEVAAAAVAPQPPSR